MDVKLPSGAHAVLLAPDKLKAKHQRAVGRALTSMEQRPGGVILDLTDGVLAIIIQSWTCVDDDGEVLPIPAEDLASIEELDLDDYEALLEHPYVKDVSRKLLELRSERVTPDDYDDPNSPTAPSSGSKHGLREAPSPKTSRTAPGTRPKSMSRSQSAGAGSRKK